MIAVLSPHLDDAVLSCWSVLDSPGDVLVVNVFDGAPRPGTSSRWDRLTGAQDSASRMVERRAEDRAALAVAGRDAVHVGLLEKEYRHGADPDVLAALADVLPAECELVAPAGISDHLDHQLVREAALALRSPSRPVTLYADLPHAIRFGWPPWIGGGAGAVELAERHWRVRLEGAGVDVEPADARLVSIASERKLAAVGRYRTQRAALDALSFRPLDEPGTLAYEAFWPLG